MQGLLRASLILGLWLQLIGPVNAASVAGLYEATVAVEPGEAGAQEQGYERALAEVMARVTGRRVLTGDAPAAALLEVASRYVQQYRFEGADELWVRFDPAALNEALTALDEPVWGAERPTTLIWLALDNGRGGRALLAADNRGEIPDQVADAATRRGLPIVLPLLDSIDRGMLTFADVWAGFEEKILAASERYAADAILYGRARLAATGQWTVRWTLVYGNLRLQTPGNLGAGIELAADRFAEIFAVRGARLQGELGLVVSGVSDLAAFARVNAYLEELSVVESALLTEVAGDVLRFRLSLRGGQDQLEQAIALGRLLEAETSLLPPNPMTPSPTLWYRYRP